jgi:thiamine transporter ThiT
MDKTKLVRKMTGTAMLAALIFIFQLIGNNVAIQGVSINLALLPIAIGAIMYGPWSGLFLGVMNGVIVISGSGFFMDISIWGTIVTCIFKTGLAGFIAGWVFKLFKGKARIPGMFIVSLLVPVINTGLFLVSASTIFRQGLIEKLGWESAQFGTMMFTAFIGINFIFEITTAIVLSPSIVMVLKRFTKTETLGDDIGDDLYKTSQENA